MAKIKTNKIQTDLGERKNAPFGRISIGQRIPSARTSYCRVVVFHYVKQNFGTASNLRSAFSEKKQFEVKKTTIESEVESVNVNKSIENAAATFDIALFPSKNWKTFISPGDWVAIYFFNKIEKSSSEDTIDNKNLVLLGLVDRIARNLERNEQDDKITLRYQVSGRNFGKVLEDTEVWYDPYINQAEVQDAMLIKAGLPVVGNPTTNVNKLLDVFLGTGGEFDAGRTTDLNQWRIPNEIADLLKSPSRRAGAQPSFNDVLRRNIEDNLPGFKTRSMVSVDTSENLWEMMQRLCNNLVNELYLELVRDSEGRAVPTVILRPRPFNTPEFSSTNESVSTLGKDVHLLGKLNGKYNTIQNLSNTSFIEISQGEVVYENIGKDDHSRFNMIWLDSDFAGAVVRSIYADKRAKGRIGLPLFVRESLARYGLKRFQKKLEFDIPSATNRELTSQKELFRAFLGQIYDQYYANHLYEAGTIETTGILEAELGKVLVVLPDQNTDRDSNNTSPTKLYYIEGYEQQWAFPNAWKTIFTVTRGQFRTKDGKLFIDAIAEDHGKEDTTFESTYLAKTSSRNKDRGR